MVSDSLAGNLLYRQFLGGNLIDLRGAGITAAYRIIGPNPDAATDLDLSISSRQLTSAIRHLGTQDTIHVIFNRSPASAPEIKQNVSTPLAVMLVDQEQRRRFEQQEYWLQTPTLYLTHLYQSAAWEWVREHLFGVRRRQSTHEVAEKQALERFNAFVDSASTGGMSLIPMTPEEIFDDLMAIIPYHDYKTALPAPEMRLNEVIGCEYLIDKMEPQMNGYHLIPIVLTAYPVGDEQESGHTMPQMLAPLLSHPGRMTISARFNCRYQYDAETALDDIRSRHSLSQVVQPLQWLRAFMAREGEIDDVVVELLNNIKHARNKAAMGWSFGEATITAIVRDQDFDQGQARAHELLRECHALQVQARIEDVNSWEAIAGTWPGNRDSNAWRPIISGGNFADLVLPATRSLGALKAA